MVTSCSACVTAIKYHNVSNLLDFFQCTYFVLYEEIFSTLSLLGVYSLLPLEFLELIKCLRICNLNALTEGILDILQIQWSDGMASNNYRVEI